MLYQKVIEIGSDLSKGILGLWHILQNFIGLILLFLVPFFTRKITLKVRNYLDSYRASLLKKSRYSGKFNLSLAIWIQRLTPYVPWLLFALILKFIDAVIAGSLFEELKNNHSHSVLYYYL